MAVTCLIEGCSRAVIARGWCRTHYNRWHRYGDPLGSSERPDPFDRFVQSVEFSDSGCWHWTGTVMPNGYGQFRENRRSWLAHRYAYEALVGTIPDGLQIDHVCHNDDVSCVAGSSCLHRRCVNPDHLRATDPKTNTLAGRSPSAERARQTHCAHGHEFTPENVYQPPGRTHRICRTCTRKSGPLPTRRPTNG